MGRLRNALTLLHVLQVVLVQDPEVPSIRELRELGQGQTTGDNRPREKRFIFDHVFDGDASSAQVYQGTVQATPLCCRWTVGQGGLQQSTASKGAGGVGKLALPGKQLAQACIVPRRSCRRRHEQAAGYALCASPAVSPVGWP